MADDAPFLPGLSPVGGKPVQVTCDAGRLTSDGGVLVLAEIERKLGIAKRLARCCSGPQLRDTALPIHAAAGSGASCAALTAAGVW